MKENIKFHMMFRRIRKRMEQLLPDHQYLQLARWSIPLIDPQRRDFRSKVSKVSGCYQVRTSESIFYFATPFNVGRYLFRDGANQIKKHLLSKYTSDLLSIKKSDVIIDIGANVGEFTCAVSELGAHVYAFEPDPTPFRCLALNTKRLEHVKIFRTAIGENTGKSFFYKASRHNDSSFVQPSDGYESLIEVHTLSLEDLLRRESIEMISLLKVEAEGYEPAILESATEILRKRVRQVAVDGGPENNGLPTADDCARILQYSGFTVEKRDHMVFAVNDNLGAEFKHFAR